MLTTDEHEIDVLLQSPFRGQKPISGLYPNSISLSSGSQQVQSSPLHRHNAFLGSALFGDSDRLGLPPRKEDGGALARTSDFSSSDPTGETVEQVKRELKIWEKRFKDKYGRDPTKDDIAKRPEMALKYKTYSKMKRALSSNLTDPVTSTVHTTPKGVQTPTKRNKSYPSSSNETPSSRTPSKAKEVYEFLSPRKLPYLVSTPSQTSPHITNSSAGMMTPPSKLRSKFYSEHDNEIISPSPIKIARTLFTTEDDHQLTELSPASLLMPPPDILPRTPKVPTSPGGTLLWKNSPAKTRLIERVISSPSRTRPDQHLQQTSLLPPPTFSRGLLFEEASMTSLPDENDDKSVREAVEAVERATKGYGPKQAKGVGNGLKAGPLDIGVEPMLDFKISESSKTNSGIFDHFRFSGMSQFPSSPSQNSSEIPFSPPPANMYSSTTVLAKKRTLLAAMSPARVKRMKNLDKEVEYVRDRTEQMAVDERDEEDESGIGSRLRRRIDIDEDREDIEEENQKDYTPVSHKKKQTQKRTTRLHSIPFTETLRGSTANIASASISSKRVRENNEEDSSDEVMEEARPKRRKSSTIESVNESDSDHNEGHDSEEYKNKEKVAGKPARSKVGKSTDENFVALRLPSKASRSKNGGTGWRGNSTWHGRSTRQSTVSRPNSSLSNLLTDTDAIFGLDTDLQVDEMMTQSKIKIEGGLGNADVGNAVAFVVRSGRDRETVCPVCNKFFSTDKVGENMELDEKSTSSVKKVTYVDVMKALKQLWTFDTLLPGQLPAIKRILSGKSTLLVIPTGAGKSLCYQLPAYILSQVTGPCLTLVISPMISLMMDQVHCLPPGLGGVCWSSHITETTEYKEMITKLCSNYYKVLFISPEKLQSHGFLELMQSGRLPPIRFVCVDEVHCLSEWSHNFRPSYLHLESILRNQLRVSCVLGLTGTATLETRKSICDMLSIEPEGVISGSVIRENLGMTVSMDMDKEAALFRLLNASPFNDLGSIIIYVMKQQQADSLAAHLRVRRFQADSYHAGKTSQEREAIQNNFMGGKIRILVATIAFGLGVNKTDIRSVVHFNMPKSLENYVQEIGRSGRDGRPAFCHLFLHRDDYLKLRSLAYSDSADEVGVRRLLIKVFKNANSAESRNDRSASVGKRKNTKVIKRARRNIFAIDIEKTERELDIKREIIATILGYLELEESAGVKVLPSMFVTSNIQFIKTNPHLLANTEPIVQAILTCGQTIGNKHACKNTELCELTDMNFAELKQTLNKLSRAKEIKYEFTEPAFCVELSNNLESMSENEQDNFLKAVQRRIMEKVKDLEKRRVEKVDQTFNLIRQAAFETIEDCINAYSNNNDSIAQQAQSNLELLKQGISDYFEQSADHSHLIRGGIIDSSIIQLQRNWRDSLATDIKLFVNQNANIIKSGRTVAKIFHGIQTPEYPATVWYKNTFWGKYVSCDFETIMKLAQTALIQKKMSGH